MTRHAVPGHPRPGDAQRTDDRRGLCAGRARPHADLRRAAHHQLRAWRAARPPRCSRRSSPQAARPRSLHRGDRPDAAVLLPGLCAAALRHRPGRARRGPQHPAGHARAWRSSSRTPCSTRFRADTRTINLPYALQRRRGRHRVPRAAARDRFRCRDRGRAWRSGSSCTGPTPARRSARSPRRSSAPSCPASTSRTSTP